MSGPNPSEVERAIAVRLVGGSEVTCAHVVVTGSVNVPVSLARQSRPPV